MSSIAKMENYFVRIKSEYVNNVRHLLEIGFVFVLFSSLVIINWEERGLFIRFLSFILPLP